MFTTSVPSQDGSRRLNCLIEGESNVFLVTVERDCVVSDLKEKIQMKRALDSLRNVGPHTLELWKVSAIDDSRGTGTWLTPTPQQVDVELKPHEKLSLSHLKLEDEGIEELTSWNCVEKYWSDQPPTPYRPYLHIMVKIPGE